MKGLSKLMISLIIIIVVGVVLLYYAWISGFLPWGKVVSEAQCYTDVSSACSGAQTTGWAYKSIKNELTKCKVYISKLPNCNLCQPATGTEDNCRECCQTDLPTWTPA